MWLPVVPLWQPLCFFRSGAGEDRSLHYVTMPPARRGKPVYNQYDNRDRHPTHVFVPMAEQQQLAQVFGKYTDRFFVGFCLAQISKFGFDGRFQQALERIVYSYRYLVGCFAPSSRNGVSTGPGSPSCREKCLHAGYLPFHLAQGQQTM